MSRPTRRQFLKTSAAASAAFGTFTIGGTKASGKVIGANDTIRIGVVGIRGRGGSHIGSFAGMDKVQVTHLIDVDKRTWESRSRQVKSKGGNEPKLTQDVREALDDKNLDAISIATCNHTHALYTIWGCQAGKDVYVEKPMSHNIFEGRQCVEAMKKYKRIVQHGTQNRSSGGRARLMAAIHSGKYGKLLVSKGYCCKPRWSIGHKKPSAPPSGLNFNVWLGPAPFQPYHGNLVHYNWHWFWDFGNGDVGNQGVHEMDIARWGIKGGTFPRKVWALGGRFGYEDQGETPNTQLAVMEFDDDVKLVFETRGLVGKHKGFGRKVTNEFYTTEGVIQGGRFKPHKGGKTYDVEVPDVHTTGGGAFGSFINCVRSRKFDEVNCDAETAHYSSGLCHLANISYRLGQSVPFDKQNKALGDNKVVVESFETVRENLKAVGMKLEDSTYQMGRVLDFDPKSEKFVGDDEANKLLTRDYRKPFVVPEKV